MEEHKLADAEGGAAEVLPAVAGDAEVLPAVPGAAVAGAAVVLELRQRYAGSGLPWGPDAPPSASLCISSGGGHFNFYHIMVILLQPVEIISERRTIFLPH